MPARQPGPSEMNVLLVWLTGTDAPLIGSFFPSALRGPWAGRFTDGSMPDRQTEWIVPLGRGLHGDPPPDQRVDRGFKLQVSSLRT